MSDEDIEINVEKGVVYVSISDKLLFDSGRYNVTNRAKEVLGKVATVVKNKPDIEFMVEGHTDDVPISTVRFPSNWELSAARASSVVRLFQERGVAPVRMAAIGLGEFRPAGDNASPEGRNRNRRVTIIILAGDEVGIPAADANSSEYPDASAAGPEITTSGSQPAMDVFDDIPTTAVSGVAP
jgi:chemotaxis protein MotB